MGIIEEAGRSRHERSEKLGVLKTPRIGFLRTIMRVANSNSSLVEQESIAVEQLMDIPGDGDVLGTPDKFIKRCKEHDVLYRRSGQCLRCEGEQ